MRASVAIDDHCTNAVVRMPGARPLNHPSTTVLASILACFPALPMRLGHRNEATGLAADIRFVRLYFARKAFQVPVRIMRRSRWSMNHAAFCDTFSPRASSHDEMPLRLLDRSQRPEATCRSRSASFKSSVDRCGKQFLALAATPQVPVADPSYIRRSAPLPGQAMPFGQRIETK